MTIASELALLQTNLTAAYTSCNGKGATMPVNQNFDNLASCIDTIQTGGGGGNIDTLTITPTTSQQTITASGGVDGYSPITVNAVTSNIDNNIVAGNIKSGVQILGVTGNYTGDGIPREVASGVYQMPANSFTFSLPNGATDLGAYSLTYIFYECTSLTGVDLSGLTTISGHDAMLYAFKGCKNLTSVDLSGLTTISGSSAMNNAFYGCAGLTSVDLSSLTTISGSATAAFAYCSGLTSVDLSGLTIVNGVNGLNSTFQNCTGLTSIDLSRLTTISGSSGMSSTFYGCSGLTSVDLSNLTTISGSGGMRSAFYGCTNLTGALNLSNLTTISGSNGLNSTFQNCTGLTSIDLSRLTTISGSNGMQNAFNGCKNLTSVDLSGLTTISGQNAMQYAFKGCLSLTSLSFPALTSTFNVPATGTTNTNQFNNMLQGVSGCTVHFPSNLQSVIGNWQAVTNGFGGTNTTVLFDLPATT